MVVVLETQRLGQGTVNFEDGFVVVDNASFQAIAQVEVSSLQITLINQIK
ncbi:hypothetical protein [Leptothermofonsia sp. ETS-13]